MSGVDLSALDSARSLAGKLAQMEHCTIQEAIRLYESSGIKGKGVSQAEFFNIMESMGITVDFAKNECRTSAKSKDLIGTTATQGESNPRRRRKNPVCPGCAKTFPSGTTGVGYCSGCGAQVSL